MSMQDGSQLGEKCCGRALPPLRKELQVYLFILCKECKEVVGVAARLAQSAERKALNLVVVGSSPTVGFGFLWQCAYRE